MILNYKENKELKEKIHLIKDNEYPDMYERNLVLYLGNMEHYKCVVGSYNGDNVFVSDDCKDLSNVFAWVRILDPKEDIYVYYPKVYLDSENPKEEINTKKYRIDEHDSIIKNGHTLYRIIATRIIGVAVMPGDKGGYIEFESNLCTYDNSWISSDSYAIGDTVISGDSIIDNSTVFNSEVKKCKIIKSLIKFSNITDSTIENSELAYVTIKDTLVLQSHISKSYNYSCSVKYSCINMASLNRCTFKHVTVSNSTGIVDNMEFSNAIIKSNCAISKSTDVIVINYACEFFTFYKSEDTDNIMIESHYRCNDLRDMDRCFTFNKYANSYCRENCPEYKNNNRTTPACKKCYDDFIENSKRSILYCFGMTKNIKRYFK